MAPWFIERLLQEYNSFNGRELNSHPVVAMCRVCFRLRRGQYFPPDTLIRANPPPRLTNSQIVPIQYSVSRTFSWITAFTNIATSVIGFASCTTLKRPTIVREPRSALTTVNMNPGPCPPLPEQR